MKFKQHITEATDQMLRGRKELPSELGKKGLISSEDAQYVRPGTDVDVYEIGTGAKIYVNVISNDGKTIKVAKNNKTNLTYKIVDNGTMEKL